MSVDPCAAIAANLGGTCRARHRASGYGRPDRPPQIDTAGRRKTKIRIARISNCAPASSPAAVVRPSRIG